MEAASPPTEFGKYRLIRKIAVGGMAQIWLAVQRGPHGFEKTAVLKVILPELCSNDEFVHMFLDEARLAAGLDHNNVVRIYDFGELNGQYYIAMEHLPGEDLASVLQAHKRADKPVPIEVACDVIIGAATGLHFAHELTDAKGQLLNVVHRDVSPSNIIVTYHGTVKLVDFGIARAESNITKTAAGTLKGKVAYVSPEQAAGDPLDRRSDVFALGTVLYELITLTRPFKRESDLATLKAVVAAPIPLPSEVRPDVPPELDAIIMKAMERELSLRYQTAAEFADALAAFLVGRGYVRSDRALAAYMAATFDADRRMGKLRVTQVAADGETSSKTPSQLKHLPQHLSPIRSNPALDAIPADGVDVDLAKTAMEPTLARQKRNKQLLGLGAAAVVLLILFLVIALKPAAPQQPVADSPKVAVVTPPVEPPKPVEPPPKPAEPIAEVAKPAEPVKAEPPPPPKAEPKKAAKGKLTLDTTPWSEVFLKGRKLGDTPLVDYSLPAGLHVLTLVNEQKNLKTTIEVEVSAGKTTVKKLKL